MTRTAADSAATHAKVIPLGAVGAPRRRRPAGCSPGRGSPAVQPTHADAGEAASGCSSAGPATSTSAVPTAVEVRPGPGSADRRAAQSRRRRAAGARPGLHPANRPRRAERHAGRRRGRPGGGRPVTVEHEVDLHLPRRRSPAGGRCSCAAHPCAPSGRRSARPWRPAASAAPDPDAGTSRETVGPAAATAAAEPDRTTAARTASRPRP